MKLPKLNLLEDGAAETIIKSVVPRDREFAEWVKTAIDSANCAYYSEKYSLRSRGPVSEEEWAVMKAESETARKNREVYLSVAKKLFEHWLSANA